MVRASQHSTRIHIARHWHLISAVPALHLSQSTHLLNGRHVEQRLGKEPDSPGVEDKHLDGVGEGETDSGSAEGFLQRGGEFKLRSG